MNHRSIRIALLATVATVWLTSFASAASAAPRPTDFRFPLSGAEVVPGPGDPDGTANAAVSLFFDKPYTVCAGTVPFNAEWPYASLTLHRGAARSASHHGRDPDRRRDAAQRLRAGAEEGAG
jgi:hypothetical protein